MRIFVFADSYPALYKPYLDAQFADFIRAGHDLTIFAGRPVDRTINETVRRYDLLERTRHYPVTSRHLLPFLRQLPRGFVEARRRTRFDPPRSVADLRRRLADLARVGVTLGREPPDMCLIHGVETATRFTWLADVVNAPVALYYHGAEVPGVPRWDDAVLARAFRAVDVVFTNTRSARRSAIGRGCPPDRIEVLPVGFLLDEHHRPVERCYRPGGALRLLSAGRMSAEKGHLYALRAVRRLVDAGIRQLRYSLTADGYMRPVLERYVREHGLEHHVRFLGSLTSEGVRRAMRAADVLVHPSVRIGDWQENQAYAVQEAMLMGVPVVTTRTGGVPESIPTQMRPFSVPPCDDGALARAIGRVARLGPERLGELGEAGRTFVIERYDVRRLDARLIRTVMRTAERRAGDAYVRRPATDSDSGRRDDERGRPATGVPVPGLGRAAAPPIRPCPPRHHDDDGVRRRRHRRHRPGRCP